MEFLYPIQSALKPNSFDKEFELEDTRICGNILKTIQNVSPLNKQINIYLKTGDDSIECILIVKLKSDKHICITNDFRVIIVENFDLYSKIILRNSIRLTLMHVNPLYIPFMTIYKYALILKLVELHNTDALIDNDNKMLLANELAQNISYVMFSKLYSFKFSKIIKNMRNVVTDVYFHESVIDKLIGYSLHFTIKSNEILDVIKDGGRHSAISSYKSEIDKLTSDLSFQKTHKERLQFQLKNCETENERLSRSKSELKDEIYKLKDKIQCLLDDKKKYERDLKRKHSEEKLDSIIDELTESFRRNKLLEVKTVKIRKELDNAIYSNENKTKEIYALKSRVRELECKVRSLRFQQPITHHSTDRYMSDDDISLNEEEQYDTITPVVATDKSKVKVKDGEIHYHKEHDYINEITDDEEYPEDIKSIIIEDKKIDCSSMDIDKESIGTFNKSVDMNKVIDIKSIDDDFIPLDDEDIEYFLQIENSLKPDLEVLDTSKESISMKKRKT